MDVQDALGTGIVDLIGTATAFGQGAIASQISGNPFYSQDPAAAAYATSYGVSPSAAAGGPSLALLIMLGGIAYLILKK